MMKLEDKFKMYHGYQIPCGGSGLHPDKVEF